MCQRLCIVFIILILISASSAFSNPRYTPESAQVVVIAGYLIKGHTVIQTLKYPIDGQKNLWLVLSSKLVYDNERQINSNTDVRLSLLRISSTGSRILWQSKPLGPGYTQGHFDEARLYIRDITGDKIPEAVITETQVGAWWQPSHLDVFSQNGLQMVHKLGISSDEPLSIKDINGDGRYEISTYQFIGTTLAHSDQPLWFDIYEYKDGNYHIANTHFPGQYGELAAQIRKQLKLHLNDKELMKYNSEINRILQKPS